MSSQPAKLAKQPSAVTPTQGFFWDSEFIFSVTSLDDDQLRQRCTNFFTKLKNCKLWREYITKDANQKKLAYMFDQKKFNNVYHILDEVLDFAMNPSAVKDRGETETLTPETLHKNPYFVALRKLIAQEFNGYFEETVDALLPVSPAEEALMIERYIEKYLYDPNCGNTNRTLILKWIKQNMPHCVVTTGEKQTVVDLGLGKKKELLELRNYLDTVRGPSATDS